MGMLQSGVNQLLGTVAIASKLDPGVEKRQKLRESGKRMEGYKQLATAIETKEGPVTEEERDIATQLGSNIVEESQTRLQLDPTPENLAAVEQNMRANKKLTSGYQRALSANLEAEQQTQLQAQQAAQVQERYNQFVNMFTEGGRYR